jgi:RNA polymerase sigma factor (sigma-70 family)
MRIEREAGMSSDPGLVAKKQIDRLFEKGSLTGLDESQLLDRFMAERDELALEALLEWHGPMVLGVCRRWLADSHDIDDAFQATFLILVRKARALRDVHRLGPWLHGVAYRVAVRARADARRRRALEHAGARPECDADAHSPERLALRAEVRGLVDEEVARLPTSQRAAIVLCDLEGLTQQDAARILGWSEGSLRGRLGRARQKLRDRLQRRGVAPAIAPAIGPLLAELIPAIPTRSLIDATTRAGMASVLAGRAAPSASSVISASVAALTQGVIRTMTFSTLGKLSAATILAAVGLLAATGLVRAGLSRFEAHSAPGLARFAAGQAGGQKELESGQPIGGFVKDEQGRPVEGAKVTVAISQRKDDVPDEDIPTPGNSQVYAGFQHISVKTDDQGRWRCSILPAYADPDTRLWFFVEHPLYVSDIGGYSRRLSLKTARAMTGALILRAGVIVRGQVRDDKERPVPGAKVVLAYSPSSAESLRTTTDAAGGFIFTHANNRNGLGRWSLSVEAPGFAPSWTMIVPNGDIRPAEFRLSPGKPFRGRVIDKGGKPVAGVAVAVRWEECYHLDWTAVTDAQGQFVWLDAPARGSLEFRLRKAGYSMALDRLVSAATGQVDLTIYAPVRVRGRVIDAESKQLVGSFTVIPATNFQNDPEINWKRARATKGSDGRYEIAAIPRDQPTTVYRVRIESEGFAPAISRPIKPDEGDVTIDFALTRARPTSGVVRLTDGTPAIGAGIYVDGRGITNPSDGPHAAPGFVADHRYRTGPDGRYAIPPRDRPFGIVVVHDKGFGDLTAEQLARSADVTLRPWGRIEGTFQIRGKPGVQERIDVNVNRSVIAPGYVYQSYSATTDNQGRFVIERVMDGEASFNWSSGPLATRALSSVGPTVNIWASETLHVDLGGQGRPLIGRIVLSVEGAKSGDAVAPVNSGNARGWIELKPTELPIPPDFKAWDAKKQQTHKLGWYRTEPGKAYMRSRRFHSFPVGPDGQFRIEDITPGSYTLNISASSTPGLSHPMPRNQLEGEAERDFEIPAIPGGHTDEPLDLGTMPLKLEVKK